MPRKINRSRNRISRSLAALVALAAGLSAAADEVSFARIPYMPEAPSIDGTIDLAGSPNHEWAMSVPLDGFTRLDEHVAPSVRPLVRVGYDDEALYLAFKVRGVDTERMIVEADERDSRQMWGDQSFELLIGVGEEPDTRYQFAVNPANQVTDLKDARGTARDMDWRGDWEHAVRELDKGWEAEWAIPWKTLGVEAPRPGEVIRFNVMHNHAVEGMTTEHSVWGTLPIERNAFHRKDTMQRAVLGTPGDVTGGVTLHLKDDPRRMAIRAANPGESEQVIKYQVDNRAAESLSLRAGRAHAPRMPVEFGDDGQGSHRVEILDQEGRGVYRHNVRFRSRLGAAARLERHYPVNYLEILVDVDLPSGARAEGVVRNAADEVVDRLRIDYPGGESRSLRIPVDKWETGVPHDIDFILIGPDGAVLAERRFTETRPEDPPWRNTKVGLSDEPVEPYVPIEVEGDTLKALIKEYRFGGRSLPVEALNQDHSILAGPIRLELTVDGQTIDLSDHPIRITEQSPVRVEWESDSFAVVDGLSARYRGWMEEDGFIWIELDFEGRAAVEAEKLELVIPVNRDHARFYSGGLPLDTFILEGEPRGEQVGELSADGYDFHAFCQNISLFDYDRGFSVITDNPEGWRPESLAASQRVEVGGDRAELVYEIIGQPTRIPDNFPRESKIEFGLMSMPAKPIERKWRELRSAYHMRPHQAVYSAAQGGKARMDYPPPSMEYPAADNLDPRQGTIELWLAPGFDFTEPHPHPHDNVRWYATQYLLRFAEGEDSLGQMRWNASNARFEYQGRGGGIGGRLPEDWADSGWGHIALTWGDGATRIYVDGRLLDEDASASLFPPEVDVEDLQMIFGKDNRRRRAEFYIGAIRVSSDVLSPGDFALDGGLDARDDTLLLHDFRAAEPGGPLPAPRIGIFGKTGDGLQLIEHHGTTALAFGEVPDRNSLEWARDLGIDTVNYHEIWPGPYGAPYPVGRKHEELLRYHLDAAREVGIRMAPYLGFGLQNTDIPEARLYGDHWRVEPKREGGRPANRYTVMSKTANSGYTDFMLHRMAETIDEYDIEILYYDHLQTPYPSRNEHLGEGFIDAEGNLQARSDVRAIREYLKRFYTLLRERSDRPFIESHGSGFISPVRAAWVDRLWIGEVFRLQHVPFDFETYALSQRGEPAGMPSAFLYWRTLEEDRGVSFKQMLAYTVPFDIEPKVNGFTGDYMHRLAIMREIWDLKETFDTSSAQWLPFYRNDDYVTTDTEKVKASLYLHPDERALLVVSNVGNDPVTASVRPSPDAMGLTNPPQLRDPMGEHRYEWEDGDVRIQLEPMEHRWIRLE